MLVVVTRSGAGQPVARVVVPQAETGAETAESEKTAPNPILPVVSELAWGAGSFIVLLILMRYVAFPRMKKGMEARAELVRSDLAFAQAAKASVADDQAAYAAGIAAARAQGGDIMEQTRREVEAIRAERLGALNAELAGLREAANREIAEARAAALGQLEGVVADIAIDAAGRVVQRPLDPAASRPLVQQYVQAAEVSR